MSGPDDSQRIYALAIADLYGRNRDEAEGYRLLARAVNLTKGTPQGEQLAKFARHKYKEAGGSDSNWDRYLQVTSAPAPAQVVASGPPPIPTPTTESASRSKIATTPTKPSTPAHEDRTPEPEPESQTAANYEVSDAGVTNFPYPTPRAKHEGGAISLGILIETSQTAANNRRAVIDNLSDMIRHMGYDDEAFLVSFSDSVAFDQDLTGDSKPLENAMDRIKPERGAALLDAIAFASGHLQRIAKNSRKILLVISDGEDTSRQYSAGEALGSISSSGVEIYCIGMGSSTRADEARLKALARRSGGQAVFINGARQFRTATREVASDMGIQSY